jgi:hypothetical protein
MRLKVHLYIQLERNLTENGSSAIHSSLRGSTISLVVSLCVDTAGSIEIISELAV